ncbi:MAG TPA: hypothetical protein VFE23_20275 [Usitatibacter sp.]|jgi:hypothetical protein|nr:hypothetical protein [Usitatibacter sp.]
MKVLETDYLVIGCGAAGMAFTDSLCAHSGADVIMVDRREAPGGHWNVAYPFVRLHQPSSYYGVNSLPLGTDAIQQHGPNKGFYEQSDAPGLQAYFRRVMEERFLASGRVRHFPACEYIGGRRFTSLRAGESYEVKVRRKVVDAAYLEPSVPATTPPPFEIEPGARCIPVGELPTSVSQADDFVIIGAGKTAMDACLWLLDQAVAPERIRWVKPREAWLVNRAYVQGRDQVATLMDGVSLQLEAAARAASADELFDGLVATGQWMAPGAGIRPTMYKAAITSAGELEQLGRIENVVRLGRVRRLERDAIRLEQGSVATQRKFLHVHCATIGLNRAASVPMFAEDRITLQPIRTGLIPFNAAMAGFIEATRDDTAAKNRLCPPNRLPDEPLDWVRGTLIGTRADYLWSKEPDVAAWLEQARLNPMQGLRARGDDATVQRALRRYVQNAGPALEKLASFLASAAPRQ